MRKAIQITNEIESSHRIASFSKKLTTFFSVTEKIIILLILKKKVFSLLYFSLSLQYVAFKRNACYLYNINHVLINVLHK